MAKFPFYRQLDTMDCGPSCLRMITHYQGKRFSLDYLRRLTYMDREGVSLHSLGEAAETLGFQTLAVQVDYQTLVDEVPLPCIAHWKQNHFIVVYDLNAKYVKVADPAVGLLRYTRQEFERHWASNLSEEGQAEGLLLVMEPGAEFFKQADEPEPERGKLSFLWTYTKPYKGLMGQVALTLLVGSVVNLALPFLTQAIVDIGVQTQDLDFIYIAIAAQLMLYLAQMSTRVIRMWVLLHISTRVSIALLSDFLIRLMRLPMSFFGRKLTGDLLRRIHDHERIGYFLSQSVITGLFAGFNLLIYSLILPSFHWTIFGVFLLGSLLYVLWIQAYMNRRRLLDHAFFEQKSKEQSKLMELIYGIQEIKLQNAEQRKRWQWERIQAQLFGVKVKSLALMQYQSLGGDFINELKNLTITLLAAKLVVEGNLSLGAMLAVQYVMGQANVALRDIPEYMLHAQEAQISLERLAEIQNEPLEKGSELLPVQEDANPDIPQGDIQLKALSFGYNPSPSVLPILADINLRIPRGKVTAIVGSSGSGKTTLLKLLLKFYEPSRGEIRVGDSDLRYIDNRLWRSRCGAVMQDGYIFEDSIANNIALSDTQVNKVKLLQAARLANLHGFIEDLPLGYNTKIGESGLALSQGQKQRLLIARAVYKDPEFLFFDEATNALDAQNEREIVENLDRFFQGKTVIVVAHRLSTVKNADLILVLERGQIVEQGTHQSLAAAKGRYYDLVKNQLELGA